MTRRVEQVPSLTWVQIEEDTGHNYDLLFQTRLEEIQPIRDALWHLREIEPDVKGTVGHKGELEADLLKATDDKVALGTEVHLERAHLVAYPGRLKHLDSSLLEGHIAPAVEVGAARADGLYELLGAKNPGYTPAGETETLGQTVNDEHIVGVNVLDIVGSRDDSAVAVGRVVVAAIELIHDQGRAVTANVLDLGEFRVGDHLAGGVARVRGQDDGGAASDFGGDKIGGHVVLVVFAERDGNGGDVTEQGQHFVVGSVV